MSPITELVEKQTINPGRLLIQPPPKITPVYYDGSVSRGIAIVACKDVEINGEVSKIISENSCSIGIDVIGKSSNINTSVKIQDIQSSSTDFNAPNRQSIVKTVLISPQATNVSIN